jgi:hypothetical protein
MKTTPAGKGRAKKVQKPSTTTLVLNGVCGGGKRGRGPALHKGAFVVRCFHQNPDQVTALLRRSDARLKPWTKSPEDPAENVLQIGAVFLSK